MNAIQPLLKDTPFDYSTPYLNTLIEQSLTSPDNPSGWILKSLL